MRRRRDQAARERSLRDDHTPGALRKRLRDRPAPSYLQDFIYGAVDGTVTTFGGRPEGRPLHAATRGISP